MMDNNVNMRAKRILPGYASGCNLRQADTCLWMYLGIFQNLWMALQYTEEDWPTKREEVR